MFDYIHDVILNITSAEDLQDKVKVTSAKDGKKVITFKRNGEYKINSVQNVVLTKGTFGKKEALTLHCDGLIKSEDVPDGKGGTVKVYETGLYQLALYVKMPNRFYGEFANANWYAFGKPIMIGFEVTEEMAESGAVLAKKLERLFNLAVPESNRFVSVKVDKNTDLVVTVREEYMHFGDIILEKYDPTVCDSCLGEYVERELVKDEVKEGEADVKHNYKITPGVEPFGTAEWITENLRFPSYPRVRYKAINGDETPMQGVVYDQISFVYENERKGFGGSDSVGQAITASTIHSFYVPQAYSDQVKAMLETK